MDKKYLLPPNGIQDWLQVCKKFNYKLAFFKTEKIVFKAQLADDFTIVVEDVRQNNMDKSPFFTSVDFIKKEILTKGMPDSSVYERSYPIYYPYGTRFDEETLIEAGLCLNALINYERDLPQDSLLLPKIEQAQQKIVNLFGIGCTEQHIIDQIMSKSGVSPLYGINDTHIRKSTGPMLPLIKINQLDNNKNTKQEEFEPNV